MRLGLVRSLPVLVLSGLVVAASLSVSVGTGNAAEEPKGPAFIGQKKCRPCHMKEAKSFDNTKHAKALETLKPGAAKEAKEKAKLDPAKDYSTDEKCLRCHVTGLGKPGGFDPKAPAEEQAKLAGVQCEVCHGAGADYAKIMKNPKYKKAECASQGLVEPDEKVCTSCHNKESPTFTAFDFAKAKAEGLHEKIPLKNEH